MRSFVSIAIFLTIAAIPIPAFPQTQGREGNWKSIKGDDGAVYNVDLNSVHQPDDGTASIAVYAASNAGFNPQNLHRLWFDCHGHFQDITSSGEPPLLDIAPRSVAARVSQVACLGAKDRRLENAMRPEPKDTPAQYCKGFSQEACARIVAAVETKPKPNYCKPGFAIVGSGLNEEQLRICYVIGNEEIRVKNFDHKTLAPAGLQSQYTVTLVATRGNSPFVDGSTNLPDGTKLLIAIIKPRLPNARELLLAGLPMCEDDCIPATDPTGNMFGAVVTVLSGKFSAGPFSWNKKPIKPDTYKVDIYLVDLPGDPTPMKDRMRGPLLTTSVKITP